MENYLIDRQVLGQLADNLITAKYGGMMPAGSESIKDQLIRAMDDRISTAIFGGLNTEALREISTMLDDPNTSPDAFHDFFKNQNIDLEKTITDTMNNFKTEYLGGANA